MDLVGPHIIVESNELRYRVLTLQEILSLLDTAPQTLVKIGPYWCVRDYED